VMSEPKIEMLAADQTRTNAGFRQSGEANGLRTTPEHTGARSPKGRPNRTIVREPGREALRYTAIASVRQNSRTTRTVHATAPVTCAGRPVHHHLGAPIRPCSTLSANGCARPWPA
jgi:hypothetical protein